MTQTRQRKFFEASVFDKASMSDQSLLPDIGSIQWQEATSKKGNPYRVDKEEPIGTEAGEHDPALMQKKPFSIVVNWPVTVSGDWVDTEPRVKQIAAITRYSLIYNPRPQPLPGQDPPINWMEYTLWFTNTEHYNYAFTDKTNDSYGNNTFLNRDHTVQYDSTDPTIVLITGI